MRFNFLVTRILFFSFLVAGSASTFAQTGTISGVVIDQTYKESMPGITITVVEPNQVVQSDMDGKYSIRIKPGSYSLRFSLFGYKDSLVTNVQVNEGQVTELNLEMAEDVKTMDVIELNITPKTNTETAVITEVKEKQQVVSGISGDQISKSQDRDAAQAMRRVPGITIIDNRFILVRGLSERYNTVMINDAISPSTEAERRSFSFDLIPSNLLDRMMIYKSGSAELPGDFAGGVIKIYTRNVQAYNSLTAGMTLGYRTATTFKDFYTSKTSSTDFLGFDNGMRKLPSEFPQNLNSNISDSRLEAASKSLPNNFTLRERTAVPDVRFNIGLSRKFYVGKVDAGTMTTLNYSNTFQYARLTRKRYLEYEEGNKKSPLQMDFVDDQYTQNVRVGIVSNWSFKLNKRNKIEFKNMLNQLGENETVIREGISISQRPSDSLRNYSFRYTTRRIYSGQLSGNHEFGNEKTSYHWVVGYSNFNSQDPDLRRFRTYKKIGTNDPYKLIVPPAATTFDAARFYSNLNEATIMNSGDLEHRFFSKEDSTGISIKGGYYVEKKSRNFQARWMSYKANGANGQAIDSISALAIDQWFTPENISVSKGFYLAEGTNPTDKYSAQNFLAAGYAGIFVPYKKLNLATGVRTEYNRQSLQSRDQQLKNIDVDTAIISVLPFVNLSYNFTDKMLIRAAYSKTVNRPEFREIAPFLFYDFRNNADLVGNPDLKIANIHNVDFRWELYPSPSETFSIGGFYKRFINPIETYINTGADNPIFTFNNALYAENIGMEVELRKSFYNLSENKFLQNLALVLNGSLIHSRVDLGEQQTTPQDKVRALQGQSPYVLNAGLYYTDSDNGIMINAVYNIFGRRIFIVGNRLNPTVYEMPRHLIDLTISKKFTEKFEVRLGIQDLLNYKTKMMQDSNLDTKITEVDEPVLTFRRGTYITFGAGFTF